ncbi:TBC1 domain family member 25 [Galleria mellonella]|uniref:TBC1 domain family member 25 n=1 Tax=Galleria mellonella TaxID=7137 RepID=A0A6J1WVT3_GALME|nr:TBC1 domain family member 25 [Galleria mellonella]
MFGYSKEAVRVKVKKCEGKLQPELRKFSVDPQITSLEVLQSILVKAFDIKSDFTLSYRSVDDYGQEIYLPLLSDWDLDAAFLKAHNIALTQKCEPCVQLKVDMKPFAEASEDWEPPNVNPSVPIINQNSYRDNPTVAPPVQQTEKQDVQTGFQGLIMNQVEKTFNMVSRALNLYEDPNTPPRPPLSDIEFRAFLDAVGQINNPTKLREVIYCGGIDPSLRKVVWKHILNVYPDGMTGKERMDYIKKKANEYYSLRARWKDCIQKGMVNADLTYVTGMVRKDVLRTDRHHNFYAGSDDNQNIASLFNILTTYALNHPTVSYCQGMSDLASPLLVTMGDEAHAYICLCALMTRLYPNFLLDGEAMTLKFSHLTESLQVYDPDFYNYLKSQQADDLLFCYRWLLLEMKREFAFDDALRMLEVLWASLPQKTPAVELSLKERDFDPTLEVDDNPPPVSPLIKAPRENAYTKVCAIRRQSSSFSLANVKAPKLATCKQMNHSLDENATRKILTNSSLKHAKEFQSLDDAALTQKSKLDKYENSYDKNKENIVAKDNKLHLRQYMKSVPEDGKGLEIQDITTIEWSSSGNLTNGIPHADIKGTPLGSQIRLLRDKISVHNNKFSSSLDKLDDSTDTTNRPKVKMIKNLNEFLNFATGSKPSINKQEKLYRTHSNLENDSLKYPKITLTKTSFDENDLSETLKDSKPNKLNKSIYCETNDGSSPDDSQEYYPMTTSMTRELRLELEHLDRQVFGPSYVNRCSMICDSPSDSTSSDEKQTNDCTEIKQGRITTDTLDTSTEATELIESTKKSPLLETLKSNARSAEDIYLWENPLHRNTPTTRTTASCPQTPDEQADLEFDGDTGEIFEEHSGKKSITPIRLLRKNQSLEPQDLCKDTKHSNAHSSESDSSDKTLPDTSNKECCKVQQGTTSSSRSHKFFSSMSQELENAKRNCESLLNAKQSNLQSVASTINNFQKKYEALKPPIQKNVTVNTSNNDNIPKFTISNLPPPSVFGGGNPFLMFLCLTVLLQHRDYIMRNRMDYNELAMHFDKMVRKHNVNRVLNQARQMFAIYMKQQAHKTGDVTT